MSTLVHALNIWLIRQGESITDPYAADFPPRVRSYSPGRRAWLARLRQEKQALKS